MNLTRIKATFAAGVLACSMILPNVTAFAATAPAAVVEASDNKLSNAIVKEIKAADGVGYGEDTITFEIKQRGEESDSGVTANVKKFALGDANNQIKITASASNSRTADDNNVKDANGTWTQTIKADIDLSAITDTGVYTYDLKEVSVTTPENSGETWTTDEHTYKLRVYVTKDKDNNLTKKATIVDSSITGEDAINAGKKTEAKFENSVTKTATFSLTKALGQDDAAYEPLNQKYKFTVKIEVKAPNTLSAFKYQLNSGAEEKITPADGATSYELTKEISADDWAYFKDLPAGAVITVTESGLPTNVNEVKATYQNGGDTSATELGLTNYSGQVTLNDKGTVVTYTNDWKDVTVTGVVTDIAPYITLVVVAVAGIAAYVGFKKRIAR